MTESFRTGRVNQKRRTRRALMEAAGRLVGKGTTPSMEEIAREAEISVATAYRYFSSAQVAMNAAAVDLLIPSAEETMPDQSGTAIERVLKVEEAINGHMLNNEMVVYVALRGFIQNWIDDGPEQARDRPARRVPMIELALEPFKKDLGAERHRILCNALALTIGSESVITTRSISRLDKDGSREVTRWTATALVKQAFLEAGIEL